MLEICTDYFDKIKLKIKIDIHVYAISYKYYDDEFSARRQVQMTCLWLVILALGVQMSMDWHILAKF